MERRCGKARLELIVVAGVGVLLFAVLAPAVNKARESARRTRSNSTLRLYWGLAIHNYIDVHTRFPPGGWVLEDGTERFGCTTALLPYFDSSPLYISFDLHKPWHHPRNQPICRELPAAVIYPDDERTHSPEGYGLLQYAVNSRLMHRNSSLTLDDLVSGAANILMAGEAAGDFRPWACPWTWRTVESPLNERSGYGHAGRNETDFVLADGQLRAINNDIDPEVLRQLASGGVVVREEDLALPAIPAAYPSTKIHHRLHPPRDKGDPWSPPPEWEQSEPD
jgi:hypothetical protein